MNGFYVENAVCKYCVFRRLKSSPKKFVLEKTVALKLLFSVFRQPINRFFR